MRLSMRTSQLCAISEVLEEHGFNTCESLKNLTDDVAHALRVPRDLAAALRDQIACSSLWTADGQRAWTKAEASILQPEPEAASSSSVHVHVAGLTGTASASSLGYPTYEARVDGDALWHEVLAGFPGQVRDYLPKAPVSPSGSSVRRPASPSEPRALEMHLLRQQSARDLRRQLHGRQASSNSPRPRSQVRSGTSTRAGRSSSWAGQRWRHGSATEPGLAPGAPGRGQPLRRCAEPAREHAPKRPEVRGKGRSPRPRSPGTSSTTASGRGTSTIQRSEPANVSVSVTVNVGSTDADGASMASADPHLRLPFRELWGGSTSTSSSSPGLVPPAIGEPVVAAEAIRAPRLIFAPSVVAEAVAREASRPGKMPDTPKQTPRQTRCEAAVLTRQPPEAQTPQPAEGSPVIWTPPAAIGVLGSSWGSEGAAARPAAASCGERAECETSGCVALAIGELHGQRMCRKCMLRQIM